ncbi:sugar transferase [Rhizobium sp. C1]|uniref:sugar transferase n=1 Tax=Rhizobium sp. C1 TaxID=1349799 RepID=UPI001E3DF833|nr:sugar transferase [Rhizobium sp. C1]MCD2178929.1 sugar transferase [Rhizobium sp. C1]
MRRESACHDRSAHAVSHRRVDRLGQKRVDEKRVQLALKRGMDIVLSSGALVVLLPLLLLIALAIRLTSPGPAVFSQLRWGKDCSKIRIFKFRTMYADLSDHTGVEQTRDGDHRITPLGAILRRTNLDELPQLFNVLKGDMSLVGPRPHAIGMKAAGMLYEELVPEYHKRHRMRPGITGLAQMRGLRGPTVLASKSRARAVADLHYVENYSLMLDISILYGTLRTEVFGGSGF